MGGAVRANGLRRDRQRRRHGNAVFAADGEPEIDAHEEELHRPIQKPLADTVVATPVMTRCRSIAALVGRTIAAATTVVVRTLGWSRGENGINPPPTIEWAE